MPISRTLFVDDAQPARFTAKPQESKLRSGPDKTRISFHGLDGDGGILAVQVPADAYNEDFTRILKPSRLGLIRDGKFTALATSKQETKGLFRGNDRQISAVAKAGEWLVWIESPSTGLAYYEWSLQSLNLETRERREVSHSPYLEGEARVLDTFGGNSPVIIGDSVFWAAAQPRTSSPSPDSREDWSFDILSADLARGSAPVTVATNATMAAAAGADLVYATYDLDNLAEYQIRRRQLPDGPDTVLVRGRRDKASWITNLVATDGAIAWTVSSPLKGKGGFIPGRTPAGSVMVMDLATRDLTRIVTKDPGGQNQSLAFSRNGLAWGNGAGNGDTGQYFFDPRDQTIVKLGATRGFSLVLANGEREEIMWGAAPAGKIRWFRATLAR